MEQLANGSFEDKIRDLLKCHMCSHYLTPPIIQCEESHIICGVCSQNKSKCPKCEVRFIKIKIPFVSEALNLLKFPCCFADFGCKWRLSWDELLDHENECYWRLYNCPKMCNWTGRGYYLLQHFEEKHANSIIKIDDNQYINKYKLEDLSSAVKCVNLICALDKTFLYCITNDKQHICIALQYIGSKEDAKMFDYTINIKNIQMKLYLTQTLNVLTDFAKIESQNSICVNYAMLDMFRQNNEVLFELIINSKENDVPKWSPELLNKLRCPVCMEYMKAVICLCKNGHSFCGNCRYEITVCPICRGEISNARNYVLENMCQDINFTFY